MSQERENPYDGLVAAAVTLMVLYILTTISAVLFHWPFTLVDR